MLRFFILVFTLLFGASVGFAQDWRTVRVGDTVYFTGQTHQLSMGCNWGLPQSLPQRLLRVQFATSASAQGSDSVFHFFTGIRGKMNFGPGGGTCIDTAALSWLGPRAVRTAAGDELYFNSFGDTVRMIPGALPTDTWVLAKDTSGKIFRATVTGNTIDTVDGITDSVRTAVIQVFSGSTPVTHPYNGRQLKWSKHHGWVETVDFFQFPNQLTIASNNLGLVCDTASATRIPWPQIKHGLRRVNVTRKYAPGNEWISILREGTYPNFYSFGTTTHDSVIAFQPLDTTRGLATLQTVSYGWQRTMMTLNPVTVAFARTIHTDTVSVFMPVHTFDALILPEVKTAAHPMGYSQLAPFETEGLISPIYTAAPLCGEGDFVLSRRRADDGHLVNVDSCWKHTISPDYYARCQSVLTGFGVVREHREASNGAPMYDFSIQYLKLGACATGNKIDVAALTLGETLQGEQQVSLSPNPASQTTTLSNLPNELFQISLLDVTGRTLFTTTTKGPQYTLSTAHLPSGIFFIRVGGKEGQRVLKLEVIH